MAIEIVLLKALKIYADTDRPVSQTFYQGLCLKAIDEITDLQSQLQQRDKEIERLRKAIKDDIVRLRTALKLILQEEMRTGESTQRKVTILEQALRPAEESSQKKDI